MITHLHIIETTRTYNHVNIKIINLTNHVEYLITTFLNHNNYEFTVFHKYKNLSNGYEAILYLLNNKYIKLYRRGRVSLLSERNLMFPKNNDLIVYNTVYASTFKIAPSFLIKLI